MNETILEIRLILVLPQTWLMEPRRFCASSTASTELYIRTAAHIRILFPAVRITELLSELLHSS
jgi:hypothetical protein